MKIVVINGPNLNLQGKRELEIYGSETFEHFIPRLRKTFRDHEILYHQTNHEGTIIDLLHKYGFSAHGIVLNPAGYTHTSIAIRDAVAAIKTPVAEVHISDIRIREPFRRVSFLKGVCAFRIMGRGLEGYREAIGRLIELAGGVDNAKSSDQDKR